MKYKVLTTFAFSCLIAFFTGAESTLILAQGATHNNSNEVLPPASERFSPADDLLASWRISKCALKGSENLKNYCFGYGGDTYYNASVGTLYNNDGTIWQKLELNMKAPGYFMKVGIKDFIPFSTDVRYGPLGVILRMAGESPIWYEVEINENTRVTKFARRDDKAWSRTKWEGWLYQSVNLYLNKNQAPLRDAPDGKIIASSESIKFERVKFLKAEGDWAYVEGIAKPQTPNSEIYIGWIRWRNGRNILVGCYFNQFKVPETLPNAK